MKKYRKKPVVIEAAQFIDNHSAEEILKWSGTPPISPVINPATGICERLSIQTLEGPMSCPRGWWVIKGVRGEFYSCEPEIFEQTYDPIPNYDMTQDAVYGGDDDDS